MRSSYLFWATRQPNNDNNNNIQVSSWSGIGIATAGKPNQSLLMSQLSAVLRSAFLRLRLRLRLLRLLLRRHCCYFSLPFPSALTPILTLTSPQRISLALAPQANNKRMKDADCCLFPELISPVLSAYALAELSYLTNSSLTIQHWLINQR